MNVIELLQGQLDENLIQQLSQHIGAESTEQTEAAASVCSVDSAPMCWLSCWMRFSSSWPWSSSMTFII